MAINTYLPLIQFLMTPSPRSDWKPAVFAFVFQYTPDRTPNPPPPFGGWAGILTATLRYRLSKPTPPFTHEIGFIFEGELETLPQFKNPDLTKNRGPLTVRFKEVDTIVSSDMKFPGRIVSTGQISQGISLIGDNKVLPKFSTDPLPQVVDKDPNPWAVISGTGEFFNNTDDRFPLVFSPTYVRKP
jgi:hypothetical protein